MTFLIEENDVGPVTLSIALEQSAISHLLEEDENLYIDELGIFPHWVNIHQDAHLIFLKTHTGFRAKVSEFQRLEIANKLNSNNIMLTAFVKNDNLMFDHVINFKSGLLRETFIRAVRQFARNVERGIARVDIEEVFLLKPGEVEEQN